MKKTERKREAEMGRDRGRGEGREKKRRGATEIRRDREWVGGPCAPSRLVLTVLPQMTRKAHLFPRTKEREGGRATHSPQRHTTNDLSPPRSPQFWMALFIPKCPTESQL